MRAKPAFFALSLLSGATTLGAVAASCGGSGTGTTGSGTTTTTGAGGMSTTSTTGSGGSGGLFNTDSGQCSGPADCDGGVCVNGACCDSAEHVCGDACCKSGTVCLFDKCVQPGKDCNTANDCAPGQYCETALGSMPDGGAPDAGPDGGLCTQPLPLGGKCLDLPPVCDNDGGLPGPDAGCVQECLYKPPVGQLDATVRWSWGPDNAVHRPNVVDIWATPTVGRVYDGNCDGKVDLLDSPVIVFVSGKALDANTGLGTCCQCTNTTPTGCLTGVLRVLDGRTGQEVWSLDKADANSSGFAGLSVALGDIDGDKQMDIVAVTGEGFVVMVDGKGNVVRTSDKPIPGHGDATFGWGGGLSIADMDNDGFPEIAYGPTVFTTTNNAITRVFSGAAGIGAEGIHEALSTFVDLDGAPDKHLELLAGRTAYKPDGTILWNRNDITDGFPGVGDFNLDGKPEAVLVGNGKVFILDGATGATVLGPFNLPGNGSGGPPTVADFDGDGKPEIGVAQANFYSVLKPDFGASAINLLWKVPNHDLSSSVTGSSVFDFEGDGKAEVIYADECFLWVFDGATGNVRYATSHTSFTATEASLLADIDGDGHAEMLIVSNAADPSASGWKCMNAGGQPTTVNGVTWVPGTAVGKSYRGMVALGDKANSWVGTRTLWNEHTYHVSNICDDRDTACDAPNLYGSIPKVEKQNWTLPWLNNFRQNVQDKGIFDAPDATVSLRVDCTDPVQAHPAVRNIGLASLPAGVNVGVFIQGAMDTLVGQAATTHALYPGQTEELSIALDPQANKTQSFVAKILIDPQNVTFHECREDNNESNVEKPSCVQ
ncbi:MAG: VCBS repeat-containing protein [Byssovorax sp.]